MSRCRISHSVEITEFKKIGSEFDNMIFEGGKGYTVYIVITVVEFSREIHSSLRILTLAGIHALVNRM